MRFELISLVLVMAVAAGLLLGGGMPGGFFTLFSNSYDDSQLSGDEANPVDTSGFEVDIKSTGSKTSENPPSSEEGTDIPDEVTSPPITGMTGGGGSKTSDGSKDTVDDGEEQTVPPTASVSVDAPESVSVGSSFPVDVEIDTNARVYSVHVILGYEKSVISASDAEEGSFLGSNSGNAIVRINNTLGIVEYINTRVNPQKGREPGSGTLLTVTFEALAVKDKTLITITEVEVVDEDVDMDNPVIVSIEDGELDVE